VRRYEVCRPVRTQVAPINSQNPAANHFQNDNPQGPRCRPKLESGICGEHGGNPASIASCEEVGLDYVSFTPYRLRTAHLAAVQTALTWPDLEEWLENLAGFCGLRLLRTKGVVDVAGISASLLVRSVGALFALPRRMLRATSGVRGW
jgi:PEP-utilising enzyme, PEP-binding domain